MRRFIKLYLLYLIIALIGGVFNVAKQVQAQGSLTPIFTGQFVTNFFWSADSSAVVFQEDKDEVGVVLQSGSYYGYDTENQTFTEANVWPLQPTLSEIEQQTYTPFIYLPTTSAQVIWNENIYMFQSPNERYLVYIANSENPVLALADRQTIQNKIFNVAAGRTLETRTLFTLWSADSHSVIIVNNPILSDFPRYFYVTNFASSIADAIIQELNLSFELDGHPYAGGYVEDVNADGSVLLTSPLNLDSRTTDSRGDRYLAAYTLTDPPTQTIFEQALVYEQNILAAAFDPDDERYLRALTKTGIQRYDTISGTWTTLNTQINSTWVDYALFSPDGQHILLQDINESYRVDSDIYVVDLTQILPNPPTANGGADQTVINTDTDGFASVPLDGSGSSASWLISHRRSSRW